MHHWFGLILVGVAVLVFVGPSCHSELDMSQDNYFLVGSPKQPQ